MNLSIIPFALLGLVLLTGCPSSRPSDRNDDAAEGDQDDGDGDPTSTSGKPDPVTPAAAGDGDGDPAETCEAELERVKAELAECQAPK